MIEQPRPLRSSAPRIAMVALLGGLLIMVMKLGIFALTNSAAVLGDALESIVNLVASALAIGSTLYAARPADREHPYGHGKVEFVTAAAEGGLVALAGVGIAVESLRRLFFGAELRALTAGGAMLGGVALLLGALAVFVWQCGRRLHSPALVADGKHLLSDAATTVGVVIGLMLVHWTSIGWLDPAMGLMISVLIFYTGGRMILQSWGGLMDRIDEVDDADIRDILEGEKSAGAIVDFHKVRHRHSGGFHWVDLHIQLPPDMTVGEAHAVASRIEYRIEQHLGRADATAHIEPAGTQSGPQSAELTNESTS